MMILPHSLIKYDYDELTYGELPKILDILQQDSQDSLPESWL